jgi:hypothetical protein
MPAFHTVTPSAYAPPAKPSIETLTALTPVEWHPQRNACAGQDTLVGSARRPIFGWGLEGAELWPWDETDPASAWPALSDWRVVGRDQVAKLTPGNYLRLHVLYVPSGNTRTVLTDAALYPDGWIRVEVTWSCGGEETGPHTYDVQLPAVAEDGMLPTGSGALWGQVRELELVEIFPPDVDDDLATAAAYSEGVRATFTVYVRGGARVIDAVLLEHPLRHVQAHDSEAPVSCHGAAQGGHVPLAAMTRVPQTDRRDGALFDDRRWGSHQLLRVAHQQAEVLGPRILSWSPWSSNEASYEQLNSLGEDDVEPVEITSSSFVDVVTSAAGYDPARPGWLVHASHAQLHRYCDSAVIFPTGGRAVVPVRVVVRAYCLPGDSPADTGIVRIQSSPTEWIDVSFPDAAGGIESLEVVGWLETQVAADHATAVLQVLARQTGDASIRIYGIDIDWGWTP